MERKSHCQQIRCFWHWWSTLDEPIKLKNNSGINHCLDFCSSSTYYITNISVSKINFKFRESWAYFVFKLLERERERESYVILVFQILFTFSQSHEHWTVFLRFTCRQTTIIGLTREAKKNNNVPSKNKPTHRQTDDTHIHAELIWLANILLFDLTWQKYCDSSQIIYIHTYKNPQINCRYLWLRI